MAIHTLGGREISTQEAVHEPKMKRALQRKALEAYRKHGTLTSAAKIAEVDKRTLKAWIEGDPGLKQKFKEADEAVTDDLEESAIEQAKNGAEKLMVHLLSSRSDRYKVRSTVTVETPDLDGSMENLRQIVMAQPILKPTICAVLRRALDVITAIDETQQTLPALEHDPEPAPA